MPYAQYHSRDSSKALTHCPRDVEVVLPHDVTVVYLVITCLHFEYPVIGPRSTKPEFSPFDNIYLDFRELQQTDRLMICCYRETTGRRDLHTRSRSRLSVMLKSYVLYHWRTEAVGNT